VEVDAGQTEGRLVQRIWLDPEVNIHPAVGEAIPQFDAVVIGPGSFYTSLMPIFLVKGMQQALARVRGPVILVANLLTEGRGMNGFTVADEVCRISTAIGRAVDVAIINSSRPSDETLARYAAEHKEPLDVGTLPPGCQAVEGAFWVREMARHDRRRLAYTVWAVLAQRLLGA
jgi:uncharacterized cofD-like protein